MDTVTQIAMLTIIVVAVGGLAWLLRLSSNPSEWERNGKPRQVWTTKNRPKLVAKPDPAWYESIDQTVAIRPYASADLATLDANRAAVHGWTVQSVTTSDGHVNVGRTVTGAVFTGGLSLLVGGSRTKGSVTVTYLRPAVQVAV